MSQHTLMTTRERKMQAAAICREIQGSDEMDLGKKMSTPKDIMLEELSLASNRGSRLFKMRQRRSEKYTFESIQNQANTQINGVTVQVPNDGITEIQSDGNNLGVDQPPKTPPNTPDTRTLPNPDSIAPGFGGSGLKEMPVEKFNITAIPRCYHSPWNQALYRDPSLADTLGTCLPEREPKPEGPEYKSFNRVATPFGGFDKTARLTPFKAPEVEPSPWGTSPLPPVLPANTGVRRPTFNRTALGWVADGAPLVLPTVTLEPPSSPMFIPESDDL